MHERMLSCFVDRIFRTKSAKKKKFFAQNSILRIAYKTHLYTDRNSSVNQHVN